MNLRISLLLVVSALFVAGCGGGESDSKAAWFSAEELGHVHGMGVNPSDGALFLAAHNGVFRLGKDGAKPSRIADRYQDTMAFAIVGPNHFLASGHPDQREDLPPFIGLLESVDAAENWRPVSLMGEVDFHILEATPKRIYGFGSDFESREARFLSSSNNGKSWKQLPVTDNLISLAIDPEDDDRVLATGEQGVHSSTNGGRTWAHLDSSTGFLVWPEPAKLFRIDMGGLVTMSADRGKTWQARGQVEVEPAVFESAGPNQLLVATFDGRVLGSTDDGSSWKPWRP